MISKVDLSIAELHLLSLIGQHPEYDRKRLIKETGLTPTTVYRDTNIFRSYGYVVKAPIPDQVDKGYEWQITGDGKRFLTEKLEKMDLEAKLPLKAFVPLGVRRDY